MLQGHVCPGMLAAFRKRKSSNGLQVRPMASRVEVVPSDGAHLGRFAAPQATKGLLLHCVQKSP